ncbi:phage protease [uncultured Bartonella sp.]|uniref:phage protease n=1 Tax=uncultured Bartonella sp. TaxID=104108 RepID=UPI002636C97D|nr:phage protease [uncultured Bartonella sp.]
MPSPTIFQVKPLLFETSPDNTRKQWIQLVPAGRVETVDNRGPFMAQNLNGIIETSFAEAKATSGSLPIDYNHSIDIAAPKGKPSPAAGWITKLEARNDGIWGLAEWTPTAFNQIKDREYRFISPVLVSTSSNVIRAILRASLTNNPALTLVSLNSANKGLLKFMKDFLSTLRKTPGLDDTADETAIPEKVSSLTKVNQNSVDPAKYVPIELFQNTVNELKRVHAGVTKESAEREVSAAIRDFKIFPFMREWAVELCTVNKPAFDAFLNKVAGNLTVLERLSRPSPFKDINGQNYNKKPAVNKVIASNLGLSEADIETFGTKDY